MKVLVRNNSTESTEILDNSEFISVALDQIGSIAQNLKSVDESEKLLDGLADILELAQEILSKNNINPINVIHHASNLRNEFGSFTDKKAISTQDKE